MPKVKNICAALPEPETIDVRSVAIGWLRGDTDLVVVLGPTASGKTRYAVRLAEQLDSMIAGMRPDEIPGVRADLRPFSGAEIISADSRQVYRGMDIGTGKDLCEYGPVPYHLIDIAEAGERYNVYRFVEDFRKVYADIRERGALPILCGGTGMYIDAVTSGYDFNSRTPLSAVRERRQAEGLPGKCFFIGTLVSREVRNARIDARLDARLDEGMVDEVKGLLDSGVPEEVLLGYGLEYKYVTLYLTGRLDYALMREKLAVAIHQFAKRQMTWFRGMERGGVEIHWTEV